MSETETVEIVDDAGRRGRIVRLRLPLDEEDEEPWTVPPSRRRPRPAIAGALLAHIGAVLGDQLYVVREGLPPGLINRLARLAAFQNPAFYAAQAMRRSTFGTPRIVACAELLSHHIALPRGCLETMERLLDELDIGLDLRDERNAGRAVETTFLGELTPEQVAAADALLAHDKVHPAGWIRRGIGDKVRACGPDRPPSLRPGRGGGDRLRQWAEAIREGGRQRVVLSGAHHDHLLVVANRRALESRGDRTKSPSLAQRIPCDERIEVVACQEVPELGDLVGEGGRDVQVDGRAGDRPNGLPVR